MSTAQKVTGNPIDIDNTTRDVKTGKYHCPACGAAFTRRSNLRRHYSIHSRVLAFKCNACQKAFARSDQMRFHIEHCPNRPEGGATFSDEFAGAYTMVNDEEFAEDNFTTSPVLSTTEPQRGHPSAAAPGLSSQSDWSFGGTQYNPSSFLTDILINDTTPWSSGGSSSGSHSSSVASSSLHASSSATAFNGHGGYSLPHPTLDTRYPLPSVSPTYPAFGSAPPSDGYSISPPYTYSAPSPLPAFSADSPSVANSHGSPALGTFTPTSSASSASTPEPYPPLSARGREGSVREGSNSTTSLREMRYSPYRSLGPTRERAHSVSGPGRSPAHARVASGSRLNNGVSSYKDFTSNHDNEMNVHHHMPSEHSIHPAAANTWDKDPHQPASSTWIDPSGPNTWEQPWDAIHTPTWPARTLPPPSAQFPEGAAPSNTTPTQVPFPDSLHSQQPQDGRHEMSLASSPPGSTRPRLRRHSTGASVDGDYSPSRSQKQARGSRADGGALDAFNQDMTFTPMQVEQMLGGMSNIFAGNIESTHRPTPSFVKHPIAKPPAKGFSAHRMNHRRQSGLQLSLSGPPE